MKTFGFVVAAAVISTAGFIATNMLLAAIKAAKANSTTGTV